MTPEFNFVSTLIVIRFANVFLFSKLFMLFRKMKILCGGFYNERETDKMSLFLSASRFSSLTAQSDPEITPAFAQNDSPI